MGSRNNIVHLPKASRFHLPRNPLFWLSMNALFLHLDYLLVFAGLFRDIRKLDPQFRKLLFRQAFQIYHAVFRPAGADELIQLDLDGHAVPVLAVLDDEDHHEGDNGRAGVDDQLPGFRIAEKRTTDRPNDKRQHSQAKSYRTAGRVRDGTGETGKSLGQGMGALVDKGTFRFFRGILHDGDSRERANQT